MNFNFMNNNGQSNDQDNQKFHNPLMYNFNPTVTNTENTNWNSSNISNDYSNKGYQTLQEVMSSMQQNDSQRQPLTSKPKYTSKKRYGPEDFQVLKLLGKGTFGQVYQVRGKKTNKIYAMKVLSKSVIIKKNEIAHTIGERNILVKTSQDNLGNSQNKNAHNSNNIDVDFVSSNQNNKRCPFIVGLKFSFQTPTDLYLVIDFMAGGELFWHLQKAGRFSELRTKFYIAELVIALEYLHDNDIIYRDLKPENILLDSEGHIALCDFGLSKDDLKERTKTFCGTTEYLAPELLLDETGYTKMVDFWSLGVLIFEMCCGWSPFFAEDNQQMYQKIAFGKVKFPRDVLSPYGRSFVKGLLNRNPRHRLGAIDDGRELRKHPFLQDIDWDLLLEKKIQPPFKPIIQDDLDTSNFDPHFTAHEIDHQAFFPTSVNNHQDLNKTKNPPLSQTIQNQFQGFTFVDHSAIPLESPSQNSAANMNSSYMNRKLQQNSYFLQQGSFIPGDPNMPADEDVIDENDGWMQQGGVDMDIMDTMTKDDDEDEHMGFQFD